MTETIKDVKEAEPTAEEAVVGKPVEKPKKKRRVKRMIRKDEIIEVPINRQSFSAYIRMYFENQKRDVTITRIRKVRIHNKLTQSYHVTYSEMDFED